MNQQLEYLRWRECGNQAEYQGTQFFLEAPSSCDKSRAIAFSLNGSILSPKVSLSINAATTSLERNENISCGTVDPLYYRNTLLVAVISQPPAMLLCFRLRLHSRLPIVWRVQTYHVRIACSISLISHSFYFYRAYGCCSKVYTSSLVNTTSYFYCLLVFFLSTYR